jgi:ATP-dependent RNA helicase DeaD
MLAALLQYSFQDELNEKSYAEIEDSVAVVDTKGKTRLFVTQGKQDGLTRDKLVDYIRDKCGCGLSSAKIKDIQILDKFSFVTLPFHEAEILLTHFKHQNKKKGPFIKKAKMKGEKEGV